MNTQPVIFLDFDGVIRTPGWNSKPIELLNALTEVTGGRVVVSSDWRHSHTEGELRKALEERDVFNLEDLDTTPIMPADLDSLEWWQPRCNEIEAYVQFNNVTRFVVLDDMEPLSWSPLAPNLVLCNPDKGFTEQGLKKALEILKYV